MLIEITPALRRILDHLKDVGGNPLLVGGCVRDALLGLQVSKDVDIECYGISYKTILDALEHMGHVDIVGATFQVVNVIVDGEPFDVALPRRDSKVGLGHKDFLVEVDHTMSYKEASARREYTINSMGWNPFTDELLDPHNGYYDLNCRELRHINDQFGEDPLRVLRGMQFAARFGLEMHPYTVKICRSLKDEFQHLTIERVWKEWKKLLTAPFPSVGLRVLEQTEWLDHFPELKAIYGIPQDPIWHPEGDVDEHTRQVVDYAASLPLEGEDRLIAVLGGLCHDFGKATHTTHDPDGRIRCKGHAQAGVAPTESFLKRIGAPRGIIDKVLPLVREHMRATEAEPTPKTVRRLVRDLAPATIGEWVNVVHADRGGRGTASTDGSVTEWLEVAQKLDVDSGPPPAILKGEMLIDEGLKPGPIFSKIIKASLEAQDAGFIFDADSAKDWLTSYILYLQSEE